MQDKRKIWLEMLLDKLNGKKLPYISADFQPIMLLHRKRKSGETVLREEDKVMQVKNDYDLEWTRYDDRGLPMEHGSGVFNGDIGRIGKIDELSDTVTVIYDENRYVEYDRKQVLTG